MEEEVEKRLNLQTHSPIWRGKGYLGDGLLARNKRIQDDALTKKAFDLSVGGIFIFCFSPGTHRASLSFRVYLPEGSLPSGLASCRSASL